MPNITLPPVPSVKTFIFVITPFFTVVTPLCAAANIAAEDVFTKILDCTREIQ